MAVMEFEVARSEPEPSRSGQCSAANLCLPPFVDDQLASNRILDLARESEECVFTLMLSADERVRGDCSHDGGFIKG